MSMTTSSSSAFKLICLLHSAVALSSGALMMFDMKGIYTFTHGIETATKLLGSSPHDQLLIRTSDSFSGLLLFAIGFLLFMVSFVKDKSFQSFFAKGCTVLHVIVAMWRFWFERRVEELAWDWLRQTVGDILLGLSWVFFLVYSWREKAACSAGAIQNGPRSSRCHLTELIKQEQQWNCKQSQSANADSHMSIHPTK
ncbi:hypothetical protein Golob_027915, partial [Gossypium lobatum]|nr:hypothetical protein [Gossypium lobatum]